VWAQPNTPSDWAQFEDLTATFHEKIGRVRAQTQLELRHPAPVAQPRDGKVSIETATR
jgi:hypothetical protein